MSINYSKNGDYLVPNLTTESTKRKAKLGKYSYLRLEYLKQNKRWLYTSLLMQNKLTNHLENVQQFASQKVESLVKKLAEKENIAEELKANNQLKWVRFDE